MENITLKAELRELNRRDATHLVKEDLIPAELYGHNVQNMHLTLNLVEFEKVSRKAGESTVISLQLPDGSTRNVIIADVQKHYLTSRAIHVDLREVSMTEKLTAHVEFNFIGESLAVKGQGGTLVKVLSGVDVEALPKDLPQHLDVDISALDDFEKVIAIKDIAVPAGVTVQADAEEIVAKVQPPRDVEAEMASQIGDVSQVEGVADKAPEAPAAE